MKIFSILTFLFCFHQDSYDGMKDKYSEAIDHIVSSVEAAQHFASRLDSNFIKRSDIRVYDSIMPGIVPNYLSSKIAKMRQIELGDKTKNFDSLEKSIFLWTRELPEKGEITYSSDLRNLYGTNDSTPKLIVFFYPISERIIMANLCIHPDNIEEERLIPYIYQYLFIEYLFYFDEHGKIRYFYSQPWTA